MLLIYPGCRHSLSRHYDLPGGHRYVTACPIRAEANDNISRKSDRQRTTSSGLAVRNITSA